MLFVHLIIFVFDVYMCVYVWGVCNVCVYVMCDVWQCDGMRVVWCDAHGLHCESLPQVHLPMLLVNLDLIMSGRCTTMHTARPTTTTDGHGKRRGHVRSNKYHFRRGQR